MSSRSPSPISPEPRNLGRGSRDESRSSMRRERVSVSPPPDKTRYTSKDGSRSPEMSAKSQSHSKRRSDSSSHSSKHSHTQSKSPQRRHEHSTARWSRSRSRSPKVRRDQSGSSRRSRSRSRSRSESPHHSRHAKKSRSRSPPPLHRRRDRHSRSRSKSPSHRREYSRRSRSRSRSPGYSKSSRGYDYKQYGSWHSRGNRRGFHDRNFHKRNYKTSTPIAKEPCRGDTTTPTVASSSSVQPADSTSEETTGLEKLTPEQKLERALLAAQALKPKISVPQPSISALSATAASAAVNPLLRNPAAVAQKKKLVWNKKSSSSNWDGVSLGEDGDEQAQAKFRRLMGMGKSQSSQPSSQQTPTATMSEGNELKEKHEKLRRDLEQQYETSRYMTHLARGTGLGFGFSSSYDNSS